MTLFEQPIVLIGYLIALLFAVLSLKRVGGFVCPLVSALFLFGSTSYGILVGIDTLEIMSVFLVIMILAIVGALKETEKKQNEEEKK